MRLRSVFKIKFMGSLLSKMRIVAVILGILIIAGAFYFGESADNETVENGNVINAIFVCSDGERIEAVFQTEKRTVDLKLSDGRALALPQTISASGARYAKADESFVFWNKGDTAFIMEDGATTYEGCINRAEEK